MTSWPPRRLVARGRLPLGRICRDVPSVMDRSAFLGPGGWLGRVPLLRSLQPALLLLHEAGRLEFPTLALSNPGRPSCLESCPCHFPSVRSTSPPSWDLMLGLESWLSDFLAG